MRELFLYEKIVSGEKRAISKVISILENEDFDYLGFLKLFSNNRLNSTVWGITGPPGVGKSTIIGKLISIFKQHNNKKGSSLESVVPTDVCRIGIVMVDPTSPITGGALLGDRLRLSEFSEDMDIFIRSMASRGKLGGLSYAAYDAIDVLACAGYKTIIIESVGIGQQEIDLGDCSDVLILVLSPESGDFIQAMKAGILEVADMIVVNKSDRTGADMIVRDLQEILHLRKKSVGPTTVSVPILQISAIKNDNIENLFQSMLNIVKQKNDKKNLIKECIKKRIYNYIEKITLQKISSSKKIQEKIEIIADSIFNTNGDSFRINDLFNLVTKEIE